MLQRIKIKLASLSDRQVKLLVVIIVFMIGLLILQPWSRPSSEMSNLRQVEADLSLPEPSDRTEDDRGEYINDSGVTQHARSISLEYDSSEKLESAIKNIEENNSWKKTSYIEFDDQKLYGFVSSEKSSCINTESTSKSQEETQNVLIIRSSSDDACKDQHNNS